MKIPLLAPSLSDSRRTLRWASSVLIVFVCFPLPGFASRGASGYSIITDVIDSGGTLTASATYSNIGSIGGVVGAASSTAFTVDSGYVAQISSTDSNSAPVLTAQPSSPTVIAGNSVNFTVAASGSPTPTYEWQRLPVGSVVWSRLTDGGAYAGTTTASLLVGNATFLMNGDQFRCLVTNTVGVVTSNAGALTVTTGVNAPSNAVIIFTVE